MTKVTESDQGSSGTPIKTECAETQTKGMTKDNADDTNVGRVAMSDIHKRMENELDEKGNKCADEMEMAHASECVDGCESMEFYSDKEEMVFCETQGKGTESKEEIQKIESTTDISKDEFDSVSDLDENAENEDEGKKVKAVSF